MLIVHFIGLAMFLGTGFAFMILEIANAKLEKSDLLKFSIRILPLSRIGHIGLFLLILSGGYLMTPYWQALGSILYLKIKLGLVILLAVVISIIAIYSKKAKTDNAEKYLAKIEPYSKAAFVLGFAIIILAVLTFH